MNTNQHDRENHTGAIKRRKDHFIIASLVASVIEIFALLSPFFMEKSLILFAIVVPIFMFVVCLSYFNEKMIYDDDGITFINMLKRSEHFTWDKIVVEDTFESSHTMQRAPIRVLNIRCTTAQGRIFRMRYPFNDYLGIQQFLFFYMQLYSFDNNKQQQDRTDIL